MGRASGAGKGFQDRRKHEAAILRAEDGLCSSLGMRHQSKDIAALVADAGDMVERAAEAILGSEDGRLMFASILDTFARA